MKCDLRHNGFTMVEILVAIVIIAISGTTFLMLQRNTWFGTMNSNKILQAGQIIERQIEDKRMQIASNPGNFASVISAMNNVTVQDSNKIDVVWKVSSAYDKSGVSITNVRTVELRAKSRSANDTLVLVTTCISKNF